jgi:hypothetical protein
MTMKWSREEIRRRRAEREESIRTLRERIARMKAEHAQRTAGERGARRRRLR